MTLYINYIGAFLDVFFIIIHHLIFHVKKDFPSERARERVSGSNTQLHTDTNTVHTI